MRGAGIVGEAFGLALFKPLRERDDPIFQNTFVRQIQYRALVQNGAVVVMVLRHDVGRALIAELAQPACAGLRVIRLRAGDVVQQRGGGEQLEIQRERERLGDASCLALDRAAVCLDLRAGRRDGEQQVGQAPRERRFRRHADGVRLIQNGERRIGQAGAVIFQQRADDEAVRYDEHVPRRLGENLVQRPLSAPPHRVGSLAVRHREREIFATRGVDLRPAALDLFKVQPLPVAAVDLAQIREKAHVRREEARGLRGALQRARIDRLKGQVRHAQRRAAGLHAPERAEGQIRPPETGPGAEREIRPGVAQQTDASHSSTP